MKTLLQCALLVQLTTMMNTLDGSSGHIVSSSKAVQLIQTNMLEVIKAIAYRSPSLTVHQEMFEQHVVRLSWLPGYILKKDPESRMKVVDEILKPCIQEHNLDLLRLPRLWRVPFAASRSITCRLKNCVLP